MCAYVYVSYMPTALKYGAVCLCMDKCMLSVLVCMYKYVVYVFMCVFHGVCMYSYTLIYHGVLVYCSVLDIMLL